MLLAIQTGIAPSVWAQEDERAIVTALELLKGDNKRRHDASGRQMSG